MDSAPLASRFAVRDGPGLHAGFSPSAWISAAEFAAVRAHPRLAGAVAAFAQALIDIYEGNALLNALLCDRGRVMVGFFLLYLEVLPAPGTDAPGATLGAIQDLCRRTRLCSPGRTASVLAAMRFGGYAVPRADPADHRRRILIPTPKLVAAHQGQWVRQFEAMAPVFPGAAPVPGRLEDHAFRTAFLHQLGAHFFAGCRVLDHVPVLRRLAESNAGLLMMSGLVLRQLTGGTAPGGAVPVSISALARRFCVSRAHVRNMLAASERAGLLVHSPGSDSMLVLPALTEAVIQFYGVLFILFDRCAAGALEARDREMPMQPISASGNYPRPMDQMDSTAAI